MELKIKRINPSRDGDIALPSYSTESSSGLDLRCSDSFTLEPGKWAQVPTGLQLEIPPSYEGQVRPRSGLAARHGITCLNSPGTIDSDYRGELCVLLINHGPEAVDFKRGDRIAQLVVSKYEQVNVIQAEELSSTVRGSGGFGHTGTA